jgi:D-xylose transport system substrate-binding protein
VSYLLRRGIVVGAVLALGGALTACGGDDGGGGEGAETAGGDGGGGGGGTIALLLPESQTTRYEAFDRPFFEEKVAELCPDCEIIYSNANQDEATQQQQVESALTEGIDVMVLDPVNGQAAGPFVTQAQAEGVPVVSYDRLILDAPVDYYISFDNERVGMLQGEAMVEKLQADGASGGILMINGSPTDNNATLFKQGAHSVIDGSGFEVLDEYDTVEWLPQNAQDWMDGKLAELGPDGFVGVYAANDGTAGGAIAAMKAAGMAAPLPPVTGQDAELAAIQRIVASEQYMTVYKALRPEAEQAAELAVALVNGETPETDATVNNGAIDVPSVLLDPVSVTVDNIMDTVVADEFYSVEDICTAEYAEACTAAGLQ